MIGYFIKLYGPDGQGDEFNDNYLNEYKNLIKKYVRIEKYADDLDLLLVQYHLSGKNNVLEPDKKEITLLQYSKKDRSIAIYIPIMLSDFFNLTELERKQKLCQDVEDSICLLEERMNKKKMRFDSESLRKNVGKANSIFLGE